LLNGDGTVDRLDIAHEFDDAAFALRDQGLDQISPESP
jgi:hypothetical protein